MSQSPQNKPTKEQIEAFNKAPFEDTIPYGIQSMKELYNVHASHQTQATTTPNNLHVPAQIKNKRHHK